MRQAVCHFVIIIIIICEALAREARAAENHGLKKFGKLCIQEIFLLRKSSVLTSTPSCKPG